MADTGNTSTLTFGTSGFTAAYRMIGGMEETREALEDTHLGTTGNKTYIPDDLYDSGDFEVEFFYDQSAAVKPPITGAAETITKTYPLKSGEATPATEAGTGFVVMRRTPELVNSSLMMGRMRIRWNGLTGPTLTSGS